MLLAPEKCAGAKERDIVTQNMEPEEAQCVDIILRQCDVKYPR